VVPTPLIHRFLDASRAGRPTGLPGLALYLQHLQSPPLRRMLHLSPDEGGVLVTYVEVGGCCEGVVREGDVILSVDGVRVSSDATCSVYGRRLALAAVIHRRCFGDTLALEIRRDGQPLSLSVTLKAGGGLVPRGQYDVKPQYYICAGLVFQPLSLEYLQTWGELKDSPPHLQELHFDGVRTRERTEVVMLTQVLADEENVGYSGDTHGMDVVVRLNGEPVSSLRSFVERLVALLATPQQVPFIELDTRRGDQRGRVVLDGRAAPSATERVLKRYQIPAHCSHHFRDLPLPGHSTA